MDLVRTLLVAMHPSDWRQRYGDEFRALLEDTRLTPSAIFDVARHSAALHARAYPGALLVTVATVVSVACDVAARRAGLTANIFWAPTNSLRTLALLGTAAPWVLALHLWDAIRRTAGRRA